MKTTPTPPEPPDFYDLRTVAKKLSRSTRTLRRMIDRGEFPTPPLLGRQKMVPRADYERFCRELQAGRLAKPVAVGGGER